MPTVTLKVGDFSVTFDGQPPHDPLDQFEGPQEQQGCCGATGCDQGVDPVNHERAVARHLANAAQLVRMSMTHVVDDELIDLAEDLERLTAAYLAAG